MTPVNILKSVVQSELTDDWNDRMADPISRVIKDLRSRVNLIGNAVHEASKKEIYDLNLLVLHTLKKLNNGEGAEQKQIECYIRQNYQVKLDMMEFSRAVNQALKKGMSKKQIYRRRREGEYRLYKTVNLPPLPNAPKHHKTRSRKSTTSSVKQRTRKPSKRREKNQSSSKCPNPKASKEKKVKAKMKEKEDSEDEDDEEEGDGDDED